MSSYLMEACCAHNHFPKMKWTWNPREAPIHLYCNQMWDCTYMSNYEQICNNFLIPLHHFLTGTITCCMFENARVVLSEIGDWFVTKKFTYIRIYGATKAPHLLPKIVTEHMVLTKIIYQTYCHGMGSVFHRKRSHLWPCFPNTIGDYYVHTFSEAEKLGESIQEYHFGEDRFKIYEPKIVVINYMCSLDIPWPYTHDNSVVEELGIRALSWKNVQSKLCKRKKMMRKKVIT